MAANTLTIGLCLTQAIYPLLLPPVLVGIEEDCFSTTIWSAVGLNSYIMKRFCYLKLCLIPDVVSLVTFELRIKTLSSAQAGCKL